MALVRNCQFFHLCILDKRVQKNMFQGILYRKRAFLDYKNKKFKQSKNSNFSKGQKLAIFPFSIFDKIDQ